MKKTLRKSVLLLLCAVIALSAVLTGCGENKVKNFPVALSDTTRSALELCKDGYKDGKLTEIYEFMCGGKTVDQLNDEYPIDCLRKDDDGCHVIYQGSYRILVLQFNEDGTWRKTDKLHSLYRLTETRGKFDELKEGDAVSKVQKTDPTAYFPFLVDKTSTDLESNHYTDDGYHTTIRYDEKFKITSVTYEMM